VIHLMLLQQPGLVLADSPPKRGTPRKQQPMSADEPETETSISAEQVKQ